MEKIHGLKEGKYIPMMDLLGLHKRMESELGVAFTKVINESDLINGEDVQDLSRSLESFLKVKHAIPCANGTDALQLAIMALDLPKGSEIIVPSHNYISAPEMIALCGHTPVFCDVDLRTCNTTADYIEASITEQTKAIIVTHLYGQPCDMQSIMALAKRHNLLLIEDNAQSIGSECIIDDGKQFAGTIGHIGTTSFYPTKVLGCLGDGGAVFTNSDEYAHKIMLLANHGQTSKFEYSTIGINSRLDTLQAAILNVKLNYLEEFIERRRTIANWYGDKLEGIDNVKILKVSESTTHVYHHYTIRLDAGIDRNGLQSKLLEYGIETAVIYPTPIHLSKAFNIQKLSLPNTELLSQQILSLPMHTEITDKHVSYIVESLIKSL